MLWLLRTPAQNTTVSPFAPFIGPSTTATTQSTSVYGQVAPPPAPEVYNQYNYYHQTPAQYNAQQPYTGSQYWTGEYSTQYYAYAPGGDYAANAAVANSQVCAKCKKIVLRVEH